MKVRRLVQCDSTLPDDGVDDEHEMILPGRNVAEALLEILERVGCTRWSEVDSAGLSGWDFECSYDGVVMLRCQVSVSFDNIILFEDTALSRKISKSIHPKYLELLLKIAEALPMDARFSNVRWYSDEDVATDRPGAAGPVD